LNEDTQVDILVVEDNESERVSIVEALEASIKDVGLLAVNNGKQALDFLLRREEWKDIVMASPPRLILLDLAMPEDDGFSVLGQIRSIEPEGDLTLTPVVIFTDSKTSGDIQKSYRCGANSYIMKPLSYPDFQKVVETVGQYWMTHNLTSQNII
jgi:two-component system, response regulator